MRPSGRGSRAARAAGLRGSAEPWRLWRPWGRPWALKPNLLRSVVFAVSVAIIVTTIKIADVITMIFAIFTVVITNSLWALRSSLRSFVLLPFTR